MKIFGGVKVAIFNPEGLVLLLHRSPTDDRRPGEWDMPGGGVEAGEDFKTAVVREAQEEAGILLDGPALATLYMGTSAHPDRDLSINRMLFMAHVPNTPSVQLSHEHDEFKWVDIKTAIRDFPHPFYREGLEYARDHGLL